MTVLSPEAKFGGRVFAYCSNELTLYGYAGSTTETYASENGHKFVALEEPAPTFLLGDIDGDGSVNITDSFALFRFSMMPDLYPITYAGDPDFTKDGCTDIADAIALFRHSMMPDLYPLA